MSWIRSFGPTWLTGNQTTTQPDRRSQNPYEDRSVESRRHFPRHADVEARQTATPSNLRLPSHDDHHRQTQLHATHRIVAPFQNDPFRCAATTASIRCKLSHPDATHSVARGPQHHPLRPPTHPVEAAGETTARATHPVVAVRPVATRAPFSTTVRYDTSSETVALSTERRVPNLANHPLRAAASSPALCPGPSTSRTDSTTIIVDRLQPDRGTNPVPTASNAVVLGENPETSQNATATTATAERAPPSTYVTSVAAGGRGPPGILPDGPSGESEEDKMAKSAFYRNGRFTRRTLPNGELRSDLVMDTLALRTFNGDIRDYNAFRDDFLSLIELQAHLGPCQKLQHLLNHLGGTPLSRAEGYGICDVAYWEVLEMLERSYGNQDIIRNTLRQDFVDIPRPAEERADLERYLEEVVTVSRRLKRSGIDVDDISMYKSILMGQLPMPLRLKLIQGYGCRGTEKVSCVLDGLRQYLNDVKEAEEEALVRRKPCEPAEDPVQLAHHQLGHEEPDQPHTPCENDQQDIPYEHDGTPTQPVETTAIAVSPSSDDRLKERRTCPLCGLLDHQAANCFMYPTIQKRLRRVLKLKICLLCLREGHPASMCPRRTKNSCKTCGHGQHHRILCKDVDDSSRRKVPRSKSSRMRTTTGLSGDPASSDHKRHFRRKSVLRNVTSRGTSATNARSSGAQRSSTLRVSNLNNRKKKTGDHGADPKGQAGTARPTTSSSDERRKQQTAKASGDGRLLPARLGQLQTEPFSTTNESTQFNRHATGGAGASNGRHEPREVEEDSSTESSGGHNDYQAPAPEDPRGSTTLQTDAIYCASSTNEHQTTLLECIRAIAENPTTGASREVLIFFDSGSTRSLASMKLARDLSLPLDWPCSLRVNTFGSELPTTFEGFSTSIVLRSKHRRFPSLAFTAGDCIVASVRTALVEPSELPTLRRGELNPSLFQVTPDILIGQDLVSHFKRQYGPTLPSGFYVVKSILGPMLGGSGNVPTAAPEAATSSSATTPANFSQRSPNLTERTPHVPALPMDLRRKHSPTHPGGKCSAFAPKSTSTPSVGTDPDAPPDAAHQDFSLSVEKNEFARSTTSTSFRTSRHTLSKRTEGPRSPRKQPNPLDNSAPLPPLSTTHVTLRQELRADPCILTSCGPVHDCGQPASVQQNPALTNQRKTRLRRRSSSLGRAVLGTKNHEELRKCETMRYLLDQPRPTIDATTHAVPDDMDPDAHHATSTFPGIHIPDVVYVAAEQTPSDRNRRPVAETPSPANPAGNGEDSQLPPRPAHPAGIGAEAAAVPHLTHPVRKEQAQELRSAQKSQRAYVTAEHPCRKQATTSDAERGHNTSTSAHGHPLRTPTGSNQHSTAMTRCVTSHMQGHRRPCIARLDADATATYRPPIPVIDGFVSKSYAALLATRQNQAHASSAVAEDLPPQYNFIGCINHLGLPSSYLPPSKLQPTMPSDSTPLELLTFEQLVQEDYILPWKFILGSTLGALPPYWEMLTPESYLHLHEEAQDTVNCDMQKPPKDRHNCPAAEAPSPAHPAGNEVDAQLPPRPAHSAGIGAKAAAAHSPTNPVGAEQAQHLRSIQKHGQRSQAQSPQSGPTHPVGKPQTFRTEAAHPVAPDTDSLKSRDFSVCGIGPTGFFLNADSDHATREYEDQRQSLLRLARIARITGKCLVLVIYDDPTIGIDLHHDAIDVLRDGAQLPADHPIHLVAYHLQNWLETFPNVIFGVEYAQLTSLLETVQTFDLESETYLRAAGLQTCFTFVPLNNLALHSGCPSPLPSEHPGHYATPTILLRTAEAFEQLTGTPKDVLVEQTAINLNSVYHLKLDLPTRAITICDARNSCRGLTIDDLSTQRHVAPGPARRADHSDQRISASSHSSALDVPHSVVPVTLSLPHDAINATCRMCAFCDHPHPSTECKTYRRVNHRIQRLRASKRCFLCLEEGHASSECAYRKTSPCHHCNRGQHHPALCRSLQEDAAAAVPTSLPRAAEPLAPDATPTVAREAGLTAPRPDATHSVAPGTFPQVMNHFRRKTQSSATTKSVPRVAHRPAKKRSAAVLSSAQAPSSQPSRLRHNRTATRSLGNQHLVHALRAEDRSRTGHATPAKTSSKKRTQKKSNSSPTHPVGKETRNRAPHGEKSSKTSIKKRTQQKSNSSPTHPVGKETRNRASHGEKTEHSSRDAKTHQRSKDYPQEPLAMPTAKLIQHPHIRCELCTQRHRAERCTFFSSTEKRRQRAQYLWLCFTCLSEDHRTEDCPNAGTSSCPRCCDSTHHQALCAETCRQATDLAEAYSTPVVVPAEAHQRPLTPHPGEDSYRSETPTPVKSSTGHAVLTVPAEDRQQEPTMAQDRRALQRQNREPKK